MKFQHLMFDLETFGTKPGSVLRSIGAVEFDPETGRTGKEFYANIDKQSCLAVGLVVDPTTEKWWAQQSQAAQDALLENCRPIAEVASEFHTFFRANGNEMIWCQGADFDSVLWEAAVAAVWPSKSFTPWRFYNVRDTRTVYDIAGFDPRSVSRAGTYHNALDDSHYQVRCVSEAMKILRAPLYE